MNTVHAIWISTITFMRNIHQRSCDEYWSALRLTWHNDYNDIRPDNNQDTHCYTREWETIYNMYMYWDIEMTTITCVKNCIIILMNYYYYYLGNTVQTLLSGHPCDFDNWPINRGSKSIVCMCETQFGTLKTDLLIEGGRLISVSFIEVGL